MDDGLLETIFLLKSSILNSNPSREGVGKRGSGLWAALGRSGQLLVAREALSSSGELWAALGSSGELWAAP